MIIAIIAAIIATFYAIGVTLILRRACKQWDRTP